MDRDAGAMGRSLMMIEEKEKKKESEYPKGTRHEGYIHWVRRRNCHHTIQNEYIDDRWDCSRLQRTNEVIGRKRRDTRDYKTEQNSFALFETHWSLSDNNIEKEENLSLWDKRILFVQVYHHHHHHPCDYLLRINVRK